MKTKVDVLIVGGGVVGTAIARLLSKYKLNVALVEKEPEVGFGATKANSGIIHAGFHDQPGTFKARLCVAGNAMFDQVCEELDVPFKRCGGLLIALENQKVQVLEELKAQGEVNGVPGLKIIKDNSLFQMEPNLTKEAKAALYAPTVGIVSPYELTMALAENAQQNGVRIFLDAKVKDITSVDGEVKCVETRRGFILADYVINAAGLFTDEIARMAGEENLMVVPRKGEEYILDKKRAELVKHVIFPLPQEESKGTLIIPTVEGNLMIGPTAEVIEDRFDLSTTTQGLRIILEKAKRLIPQITAKDIIASFAGLRAANENGDFIIELSSRVKGFINVAGIDSPGLTAAPAIAEMVVDILGQEGLKLALKQNYQPSRRWVRFRELSLEQKDELVKKDRRYGNIVCRCETVTEKEIIEAIRRGARTLDGLKFRTRVGMGRCQGGFCTPRVMKILGKELNIPLEKVTKRGNKSNILWGKSKQWLGKEK
jgi:glycerol-3-phosphate dehydrogenase